MQNQFTLLKTRRFLPFFATQALGAFNDNVFKNALMLLMAFGAAQKLPYDTNLLMNLAAGLFILPFLLFSGVAGRIADKYDMDLIIRSAKAAEIFIMSTAAVAFYYEAYAVLIFILFLMGTQSAFFGPVKYAILPKTLSHEELVGGNALVEMGTFVSILLGTIIGGILVGLEKATLWISISVIFFALCGYLSSRWVPATSSNNHALKISWNIFSQTWSTFKVSIKHRDVFLSMMAISWFWFMGASYLTQIPNYSKIILLANNEVVTLLLATFSIGVACGSLICEKLSAKKIEIGIVPIGSLGITLFGAHLFLISPPGVVAVTASSTLMGIGEFLQQANSILILLDFAFIGFFGGLYSVPLMALVQQRSNEGEKAQTIAALNILNALFMVISAVVGIVLLTIVKLTIPQYFIVIALLNIAVALFIFTQLPEFIFRFLVFINSHLKYDIEVHNAHLIPPKGAAVLLCNQVENNNDLSVEALVLAQIAKRPINFVQAKTCEPLKSWFKLANHILLEPDNASPDANHSAFEHIKDQIVKGELIALFEEKTLENCHQSIVESQPAPVIPVHITQTQSGFRKKFSVKVSETLQAELLKTESAQ